MTKSNSSLFGRRLILLFWFTFFVIVIIGIILIWKSFQSSTPTNFKFTIGNKGIHIELTTMVIGIIVFIMGTIGLLLLAIKVPVKQIIGYKERPSTRPGQMNFSLTTLPEIILSDRVERIPILLWWLIRNRELAVRTEKKERE